jgi:hypothetical protein
MRVLSVQYFKDYKLKVTFSDKTTKIVDFKEKVKHAKGIFLPLKDVEYFRQVSVDDCFASICWPNGADICPDVLYEMGQKPGDPKTSRKKPIKATKVRKLSGAKRVRF